MKFIRNKGHFDTGAINIAAVLIGFAESPETAILVVPQIEDGT